MSPRSFLRKLVMQSSPGWPLNIVLAAWVGGLAGCNVPLPNAAAPPQSHLVIIVPGTYSNDSFWPNVTEGQVSFGSELQQALGDKGKVHSFLWASSIWHEKRAEAAANLAELIESQSKDYDRVSLIGHSHGGNVALLAADMCHTPIDTIVCLATPHAYLRTRGGDGLSYAIPIYCSPRTRANVRSIVCISAAGDAVPDAWSTAFLTGVRENEAIRLTAEWRKQLQEPRLADDSLLARLFESSNIGCSRELTIADANLQLATAGTDPLGIAAHQQIHSRQMGKLLGELLNKNNSAALDAFSAVVLTSDADCGEPIPAVVAE
jgi:pimeloyl-ACP methyl ester carboxylesterase